MAEECAESVTLMNKPLPFSKLFSFDTWASHAERSGRPAGSSFCLLNTLYSGGEGPEGRPEPQTLSTLHL